MKPRHEAKRELLKRLSENYVPFACRSDAGSEVRVLIDLSLRLAVEKNISLLLLEKRTPVLRRPFSIDRRIVAAPFIAVRRPLIAARQRGHLVYRPIPAQQLQAASKALEGRLGPAEFEDASILVFRIADPSVTE